MCRCSESRPTRYKVRGHKAVPADRFSTQGMKDTHLSMFIVPKYLDNKWQSLSWKKVIFHCELYHQQTRNMHAR